MSQISLWAKAYCLSFGLRLSLLKGANFWFRSYTVLLFYSPSHPGNVPRPICNSVGVWEKSLALRGIEGVTCSMAN